MKRIFLIICITWAHLSYGQEIGLCDTIIHRSISNGYNIVYCVDSANNYRLFWYRDTVYNISSKKYPILNGEILEGHDVLENEIVLFQNCGQKSKNVILLSLKPFSHEVLYENVIGYDSINKCILSLSEVTDNGAGIISVFDLVAKENRTFVICDICTATNPMECIYDIQYNRGKILIKYYGKGDDSVREEIITL